VSAISLIGISISTSAVGDEDPITQAIQAEAFGFDFVSASDHPVGAQASYDTLTLLTWVAARTERIRIATRVLGTPFRRPAMVAKTAESLHRLAQGRLILGLGGGYSDDEIRSVGGPVPSPREKVTGLSDAIEIMRAAWRGEPATYAGAVHSVEDLLLRPSPATPIPIWLGTYGPRALAVTGRLADGWIPSPGFAGPGRIPAMLARIRDASEAAGRRRDAVRAIYNVPVELGAHRPDADGTVAGPPSDVVARLREYAELGFSGFNLSCVPEQVPAVAAEVLPALRQ
jgi:alkanesulfonate monooxygenase SsuD/methylene tetrahydromethanopterin reductase-like flavin-dependent oxidoreductase (luciferase family)